MTLGILNNFFSYYYHVQMEFIFLQNLRKYLKVLEILLCCSSQQKYCWVSGDIWVARHQDLLQSSHLLLSEQSWPSAPPLLLSPTLPTSSSHLVCKIYPPLLWLLVLPQLLQPWPSVTELVTSHLYCVRMDIFNLWFNVNNLTFLLFQLWLPMDP